MECIFLPSAPPRGKTVPNSPSLPALGVQRAPAAACSGSETFRTVNRLHTVRRPTTAAEYGRDVRERGSIRSDPHDARATGCVRARDVVVSAHVLSGAGGADLESPMGNCSFRKLHGRSASSDDTRYRHRWAPLAEASATSSQVFVCKLTRTSSASGAACSASTCRHAPHG
jgi:hypothetical protein